MVDFNSLLNRKYNIMQQEANAKAQANMAGAQEANARAALMQQQAEFNRRTSVPGSSVFGMTPSFFNTSTDRAAAQEKTPDQGPAQDVETQETIPTQEQRQYDYGVRNVPTANAPLSAPDIPTENIDRLTGRVRLGLRAGTARVPGKGDGTKDTVPAKLAPGEAVLNKAAADKMGRGLIAALNKMGAQKMGLV